ncbi:hypothetical protein [Roseateles cavernae]|uniref:hypothetical protein n=1 Tax=Roseateles cavernae TaxID=3153578 RepID=UPI0032E437A8
MDAQFEGSSEKVLTDVVDRVRSRLLALKKARIVGSKLASIVGASLPEGKTFRDLLPDGVEREAAPFRIFAEKCLAEVVTLSSARRGTDLLYDIVDSGQEIEPEPGDLWRAFVSVHPTQQLLLDLKALSLKAFASPSAKAADHAAILPVSLAEHKDVCIAYRGQLKQRGVDAPQLDDILQDYSAASYTKWLRVLRTHTPPLDREWGGYRKQEMLSIFEARLRQLGIDDEQRLNVVAQLADDAPLSGGNSAPRLETTAPEAAPKETAVEQARRRLHMVIDRMTLEQMNALLIPFGLLPTDFQ